MTPENLDGALVQPVPPPLRVTPENINQINELFWQKEREARDRRMANPAIYASGMSIQRSESERGVPVKHRMTFELAMERGEEEEIRFQPGRETANRAALSAFSRKGGKAPRENALNDLIQELATKDPKITAGPLLRQLELQEGEGTIVSIELESQILQGDVRKIHYLEEDGTPKTASVYGLKDRLARIKRKINRSKSH